MILGIPSRPGLRVLVASQPVDFRKGMDGLVALVTQALAADPFLCVAHDYVAASSRHGQSRGHDQFCRHIIFNQTPRAQDFPDTPARGECFARSLF
jgi:transposase